MVRLGNGARTMTEAKLDFPEVVGKLVAEFIRRRGSRVREGGSGAVFGRHTALYCGGRSSGDRCEVLQRRNTRPPHLSQTVGLAKHRDLLASSHKTQNQDHEHDGTHGDVENVVLSRKTDYAQNDSCYGSRDQK